MNAWQIWTVVGIGLVVLEMLTPGFIAAIFGLGCIPPAVLAALGLGWQVQAVAFAVTTLVLFVTFRPFALKHFHRSAPELKTNADALAGKSGVVTERISLSQNTGRVKCHGDDWKALAEDPSHEFDVGVRVEIASVDGITLVVRAAR